MAITHGELDSALLKALASGEFQSGQQLGEQLGVSRAAIHNHIEKLTSLGLDIFRVTGKGYRLAQPLQLLSAEQVQQHLSAANQELPLSVHHVTGSTNDDLKALLANANDLQAGTCVLAEMQTQGRGRRGKAWLSPFGSNLYLSMYWPLLQGLNAAMGLSVALGIALAEMLNDAGVAGVSVKWPNDVYIKRQKVAGILIELEGQATGEGQAIIGIGLNLSMPAEQVGIDQPFTSISQHIPETIDRNWWAGELINRCMQILQLHDEHGLKPLIETWRHYDHFYQEPVKLLLGQHVQAGIGMGIDEFGALLVEQEDGIKRYFGGEISVRNPTD